jgi:hypothetical protein
MTPEEEVASNRRAITHKSDPEIMAMQHLEANKRDNGTRSPLWIACEVEMHERNKKNIAERHKHAVWIAGGSAFIAAGSMIAAVLSAHHAARQADAADRAAQQSTAHISSPQPQSHLPSIPPISAGESTPSVSQ